MSNRRTRPSLVQGPQLGEVTFEEWFDTPVFEADSEDERLEHLATSRRAPLRLVGSAAIGLRSRLEERRQPTLDLRDRGLRRRIDVLLNRWAEAEAASQERLEDLVLPKRWRG
jgi:hypothetical protein